MNMPVRGHAVSRCGQSEPVRTAAGQGLVFSPEAPAEITWSPDCVQLCLMIPRAGLEAELERLLGRSVRSRLRFEFGVAPEHVAGRLQTVLDLVAQELDRPSGPGHQPCRRSPPRGSRARRAAAGAAAQLQRSGCRVPQQGAERVIKRAVELIEERPGEPWTTVGLATELHLSVRALQEGFKRELGMAPMAHLRMVRLRRAHAALREANPAETTVQAVAVGLGLLHQGRFAANYRAAFGESPSETLHR